MKLRIIKAVCGALLWQVPFSYGSFLSRSGNVASAGSGSAVVTDWFHEAGGVQYIEQPPKEQVVYRVDLGHQAGAERTHRAGNSTWRMVSEFIVIKVPHATVMKSGLVVSPDAVAYRMGRWYFNDNAESVRTGLVEASFIEFSDDRREYFTAIEIWTYSFQHIVFETLPRVHMACGMLQKGHMQVLVMNNLQAELIREVCPLPDSRFQVQRTPVKGAAIYLPEFRPALEMGLLQHNVLKPLGKTAAPTLLGLPQKETKRSQILYLQRPPGQKRSVINEEAVLEALRATGRQVDVLGYLQDFHTDKALFANADYIVGPHGGAMSNMLFARSGATVVIFDDVGHPSGLWGFMAEKLKNGKERPRPCFLGLAVALGLRYVPISPMNADTFSYDRPMTMDVEALAAFFAKEK